ncbi:hypothetical protein HY78_13195 [Rhizorhabdus wittichii DC-6]|nr:hypothetical protein HY78_13195 [Rhizorhabdus wittichii DC-6]
MTPACPEVPMFQINPLPAQLDSTLVERALLAEPAVVGHFRLMGFPDGGIQPQIESGRIAGTAVTLALPGADSALLHHVASTLRPGDVLVIDRLGDKTHACLGGGVAFALKQRGIAGIVIDGPAADPAELREHGVPIWSRGLSAITTRTYAVGGAFNIPVSIGGAVVQPGDLVIADEGGIVFIPPAEASNDVERAIRMIEGERQGMGLIADGKPLGALSGATALVEKAVAPAG